MYRPPSGGGYSAESSAPYSPSSLSRQSAGQPSLAAAAFTAGERVEVWSESRKCWLEAKVEAVFLALTHTEGYDVPAGSIKVVSLAGVKWVLPENVDRVLRKANATQRETHQPGIEAVRSATSSSSLGSGSVPTRPSQSSRQLCKNNCGREVQPGLTRGLKPYDTCCKRCAQNPGANEHDENCSGRRLCSAKHSRTSLCADTSKNLKKELEAMLWDTGCLDVRVRNIFAKYGTQPQKFSWDDIKVPLEELLEPFGVRLDVKPAYLEFLCKKFGREEDKSIDQAVFVELSRVVLQDRYEIWFPEVLPVFTSNFVKQNLRPLSEVYQLGEQLGEGSFGTVYSAEHKLSGERRVCKKIAKTGSIMTGDQILQEIGNMAMLDHPNVIKVFEYFDDPDFVCQIIEPCYGGELQDKVNIFRTTGEAPYDEAFICDVMKQTLRALAFMHSKPFLHKDLKPQNIMLADKESSSIKVIDFGIAELFNPSQKFAAYVGGTRLFMAPESFRQEMTPKVDIWAAGVILYNMLTGDYPFVAQWPPPRGKDQAWWEQQTAYKICKEAPARNVLLNSWSPACADLLMKMLEKDDTVRPDATQCLEHPWFRGYSEVPPTLSVGVVQCVEAYARMPELRKAIFLFLSHQYQVQALALIELRALFTHFDVRNQGSLSAVDLKAVLVECGVGPLAAEHVTHALDRRRHQQISWTEFTAAATWCAVMRNDKIIDAAFATFDADQDGSITPQDFERVLADEEGQAAWHRRLPRLFEDVEQQGEQDVSVFHKTASSTMRSIMQVFKDVPRCATMKQFRLYVKQHIEFRAGDALYAVS